MKYINKILMSLVGGCFLITSCTVNDPVDDVFDAGEFKPTVYWDVLSASVIAGDSVGFEGYYYSTLNKSKIARSEVWYSIDEQITKKAMCPSLVKDGLNYELSESELTENIRPMQMIKAYKHSQDYWNDKKQSYIMTAHFPVSYNLSSIVWGNSPDFDAEGYDRYFPDQYLETFRDSLYSKMSAKHLKTLLTSVFPRVDAPTFDTYTEYEYVYNDAGQKKDSILIIKPSHTQQVKDLMYNKIAIDSLLYDFSKEQFEISYQKAYSIKAYFKVVDENNNVGQSEVKRLSIK